MVNPLPHDALPLASTSALTAGRAHTPVQADQWRAALRRALGDAPTAPAAGADAARGEVASRAQPLPAPWPGASHPHVAAGLGAAGGNVVPLAAGVAGAAGAPTSEGEAFPPAAGSLLASAPCAGSVAGEESSADLRTTSPGRPCVRAHSARSPARAHLEQDAHGLSVWLGLDGDASAVRLQAAAVLLELQRVLPANGQRMARVVCNGVAIYRAPHLEKETP